uniref:Uncharacterized protein n=1 Tax=Eutreptiella gymnastica TaxID=73025 RepID=A0A7S1IPD1_9EUGL
MGNEDPCAAVPAEQKADVQKAIDMVLAEHSKKNKSPSGEAWHCSALMSHSIEGSVVTVGMAICSGMECSMVNGVSVDIASGQVKFPAQKKGFF